MERRMNQGVAGKPKRRRLFWIVVFPSLLLVAALLVVPYYSNASYIDIKSGRLRSITRIYLVPVRIVTWDSEFTKQYLRYISHTYPTPEWWPSSETDRGIL
jgi:hypothetical protein